MSEARPLQLERLRHAAGQMLRSRDFSDQTAFDAEMLFWHQRAVHDAFGIIEGLVAAPAPDGVSVDVTPGLAYDCFGRALMRVEASRLQLPDGDVAMTLLLRPAEHIGGTELAWWDAAQVRPESGVPVAFHDGKALRLALRRPTTRVLARPRIGAGATQPGGTAWEPWELAEGRGARIIGIQVRVDTRATGFTEVPCYFAWLQWPRVASARLPLGDYAAFGAQSVQAEALEGFTFRIALLRAELGEADITLAHVQRLHVSWLGVQADDRASTVGERKGGHGSLR